LTCSARGAVYSHICILSGANTGAQKYSRIFLIFCVFFFYFVDNLYPYRYIIYPYPHGYESLSARRSAIMIKKLEEIMEWGGVRRDITFLFLSGAALLLSIFGYSPFSFNMSWFAIILCGVQIGRAKDLTTV